MCNKSTRTSRIAASVLIICNLITMTFCLIMFALSLWVITSPSTLANTIKIFDGPTLTAVLPEEALSVQLGVVGAMLAGFFLSISFMGLYGAITASQFLLFMYAALVFLLLLLECSVMYYLSSNFVEKGIQEPNSHLTHILRVALRCCDRNATISQLDETKLPWSCCGVEAHPKNCTVERVYQKDCYQTGVTWLSRYQTTIYVSLAVFHVLLSSCSLLRRALGSSHSHT